jgi:hypothetical protein
VVTPSQLEEWWPHADPERLEHEQGEAVDAFALWAAWARRLYDVGIIGLAAGVTAALVPHAGLDHAQPWRLAAFALALAAVLAELTVILITVTRDQERRYEREQLERRAAQLAKAQP